MDMTMQLSRTAKGQEEIFNHGHTLRPKQRQIMFAIGNGISFGELRSKLPSCAELETMVNDLLQNGFIEAPHTPAAAQAAAPSLPAVPEGPAQAAAAAPQPADSLEAGRSYVLEFMATLVGTKSPAYRQMSEVKDLAGFNTVLPMCRRVIAAVASPHQAAEMEAGAAKRMAA
ncbi:MAG: hypothetical protein CVU23_05175 [Betaproteobacteria bacterium HGW-Betaproteobacteria-17]|nr:MAG: hypothetical protein CVU23_05175 [Betaproteobacteria bacterium HGW-Betaproteobacteria-17]